MCDVYPWKLPQDKRHTIYLNISYMKIHTRILVSSGYCMICVIIVWIGVMYFNEWNTLDRLEKASQETNEIMDMTNRVNAALVELSLSGETFILWNEDEKDSYHLRLLSIDSLLQELGKVYMLPGVDSLRTCLKEKASRLDRLRSTYNQWLSLNTTLTDKIPVITRQSANEKVQKPKRKGFLGLFGKKESPKPTATETMLRRLNKEAIELDKFKNNHIKARIDSLNDGNVRLNMHIQNLIGSIDSNVRNSSEYRELEIASMRKNSYKKIGALTASVIILLIISYLTIIYDIGQRERGKHKLEESIRQNKSLLEMRKRIILTISHDIRGPLNVISGSAELAIDTRDKKKRDSYLNNARYLCRHVVHLLNNLLDVYRLNEAKETPNNVPFRLNALFDRIAVGAARIINDKGLIFRHDISDMDVTVIGDEDRIEQIVDNLLSNAVKFTSTGSVGISASYGNGHLVMAISDSGIGMTEETVKRIFRPFERADNVDHVEGFGLGLSITKGLISLLGGTVQVISDVGKGTTFHVSLPLALSDIEIEKESRPDRPSDKPGRLPRNVIVIDDDPMQRDIVREMLERNSVSCNTCATVTDVVKLMRENDYDMLLTDINMPGTDGFALLELLRKSDIGNSKEIPLVAMTARDDEENRHLLGYGFAGCLFKPFSMQDLLERISIIYAASQGHGNEMTDFSNLIGELDDKCLILDTLVKATKNDVAELKKAMRKDNRTVLKNVLHRIAPTWELLDAGDALINLRNNLKRKDITTEEISALVYPVINRLENIMTDAYNKMEELRYEKQNTDC